jgi:hypothetical protein
MRGCSRLPLIKRLHTCRPKCVTMRRALELPCRTTHLLHHILYTTHGIAVYLGTEVCVCVPCINNAHIYMNVHAASSDFSIYLPGYLGTFYLSTYVDIYSPLLLYLLPNSASVVSYLYVSSLCQ